MLLEAAYSHVGATLRRKEFMFELGFMVVRVETKSVAPTCRQNALLEINLTKTRKLE